jgi:hypothetical protein
LPRDGMRAPLAATNFARRGGPCVRRSNFGAREAETHAVTETRDMVAKTQTMEGLSERIP